MRELYPAVFKRRSMHRYRKNLHISEEELREIREKLENLLPLVDDIPVQFELVNRKETTAVHGEYCVLAYSKRADYYFMNIGYMLAQVDLYLALHDIGACWSGFARPKRRKNKELEFVLMLCLGKCNCSDFRSGSDDFKRKRGDIIWSGRMEPELLNVVRLAPSAYNFQPWRIIAGNDVIDVYQCKRLESFVPTDQFAIYNAIGMGICLCYLDIAVEKQRTRWRRKLQCWESTASGVVRVASYQRSVYEIEKAGIVEPLFEDCRDGMVFAALQGYMGEAYAESPLAPWSAQVVNGDYCFFAGKPEEELVRNMTKEFLILTPPDESWAELMEAVHGKYAVKRQRYAYKKEPDIFCQERLEQMIAAVCDDYELKKIDAEIYDQIQSLDWAADFCRLFKSGRDFADRGEGVVALKNGTVVSGASSYVLYIGGIEVTAATREDERRRGLALACTAKLILECQKRNLFPNFNAKDQVSAAFGEKLGYHLDKEYTVYEVTERD